VSRINPNDVFPARNLPGEAEKWGRSIEDEVKKLREQQEITNQLLSGQNRNSAAALSLLSDQLSKVVSFDSRLERNSSFAVPSGTSASVLDTVFVVPTGYSRAFVFSAATITAWNASGSASYLYMGIDINGASTGLTNSTITGNSNSQQVADNNTAAFTGLVAGEEILVSVRVKADPAWGSTATYVKNSTFVIYTI